MSSRTHLNPIIHSGSVQLLVIEGVGGALVLNVNIMCNSFQGRNCLHMDESERIIVIIFGA